MADVGAGEHHAVELQRAARVLRGGGVVAHASEGVWGLACDPFNGDAVGKVLAIKGREAEKGLILIADDAARLEPELAGLDDAVAARIRDSWPGAVTWVVANRRFPDWITGGRGTVAVRVPGHAQARALAARFGAPIVSTSANRSGAPPTTCQASVAAELGAEIDYLLPGQIGAQRGPSRIFDAASGLALR